MSQYIVSENISTMGGLNIPLLNIRDFANPNSITEVGSDIVTTYGYKKLSMSRKTVNFKISGDNFQRLDSSGIALRRENDNIINLRISLSGESVKYYCCFNGEGTCFCDVNEKRNGDLDTSKYAYFPNPGRQFEKIAIFYYESPDGKTYYTPYSWNHNEVIYTNGFPFYNISEIGDFTIYEKSEEYGNYSDIGGYGGGSFDDSSDAFGLPSLPSLGVSEVGFINVYNPSKGQLQGFADELFPNFEMPTPSTATGIEAVAENLANTFEVLGDFAESYVNAGLINYVIDCHIVPVAPVTSGTSNIKVGFKTFNYTPAKVTSDYVQFDCGSLEIAEYYQNFLDYEGTKAKLYLPFIGFVDIKPEWFQSGKLGVTYHFNIIDGSCIAFVIATSSKSNLKETVVATFGGNCCVHMPITGVNYSSMISGVVGGAVGVASNASNMIKTNRADKGTVMSNIEGATGIASNLADAVGAKPSIEQSNVYNAGMSFMCYRRPYLLIERPVASFSKDYPKEQGLPLNVTKKLGSMKGFTTCTAPVVDNFHCLEEEKEMIKQALIEGTIF